MKTNVSGSNAGGKARQPAQPPAHAHTPWSSTWRSWPCRGAVPQPAPLPRQRGMPQLPQTPAIPFGGDADTERGTDRKQSPSGVSPVSPAPAGGSAPSGVSQRRTQWAPTLTDSHWRRQQQPLTSMFPCILAVWNIAFSFIFAVCVRACAAPRELLNPAAGSL